jgi:putative endonuclease
MNNDEIGKIGENLANKYLINKGYLILARNHRERFDEIDIIARSPDGNLIFCEVKTLNNIGAEESLFMPEDNLNPVKLRKMTRACGAFLARRPKAVYEDKGWQMDLVAVVLKNGLPDSLRHYENIG